MGSKWVGAALGRLPRRGRKADRREHGGHEAGPFDHEQLGVASIEHGILNLFKPFDLISRQASIVYLRTGCPYFSFRFNLLSFSFINSLISSAKPRSRSHCST